MNRKKILIVDDEKALRFGLVKCVRAAGFDALEAADGYEALSRIEEHMPDLVILDVMMHGISGLEVCRRLRDDRRTRDIKIIILSAKGQIKEQREGLEAGADYYITKPFDYRELLKTVKQLLETS